MPRGRPAADKDKVLDTLDEMEQAAKSRIAENGRAATGRKDHLEWKDKDPDFHYVWVTDSNKAIHTPQDLLEMGYTFTRHEHGPYKGDRVEKRERSGTTIYLMQVPLDVYNEIQEGYESKNRRKEADLLRLKDNEYAGDSKEVGKGKAVSQKYVEAGHSPLMD